MWLTAATVVGDRAVFLDHADRADLVESAPSLLPLNRVAQSLRAAGACSLSESWRLDSSLLRGEEQTFRRVRDLPHVPRLRSSQTKAKLLRHPPT